MRKEIENLIRKAVRNSFNLELGKIDIEKPVQESFGDTASSVALYLAREFKKLDMNSHQIAEEIVSELQPQKMFEKVEVAGQGFINFFLSEEYLQNQVKEILKKKEKYGSLKIGKGKKVNLEFISANPTGPLTIGNSRGGPIGDVLANILQKAGFKTEKAYYINDYGAQIKALGHSVLKDEKAEYRGKYIDILHKRIKEKDVYKAGEKAAKIIIEEFIKKTTDKMGIKYDEWISETKFYKNKEIDKTLEFLEKKGFLYKKDGATWFKSSQFTDKRDRVIVKSDGWKTYLAGDLALHRYKFEKKKFDRAINIWGADHYGDVAGLQAGLEALGHKGRLDIILCQFITLLEKGERKKMSKRKGIYVTMDELLTEVGSDVVRFFFLQKSADTHLNFDLALAKEQSEKNPVFYIQYAHARICSIIKKLEEQNSKLKVTAKNLKLLGHQSELKLIKQLIRLPEIVEDTAKDYQVQRLPRYAIELANAFHRFYTDCRVISEDISLSQARLSLVMATKIILKNVLDLMGILAPEHM